MREQELFSFLREKAEFYNQTFFIETDPVSIPHLFSDPKDIEVSGLLASLLAWGQRKVILQKANQMINLMDNAPLDFILNHSPHDRQKFKNFVHRTISGSDVAFYVAGLQLLYKENTGLEPLFKDNIKTGIIEFRRKMILSGCRGSILRHIPDVEKGSAAKRLNMFLRWMVRKDKNGVDFGIWKSISPASLLIPLDVHSARVARKLGLLHRKQNDWNAVEELTAALRLIDPEDPVRMDFALFGLGVFENF